MATPFRQRILITGASSGLGEGLARYFAAHGHTLALCARRTDRLEALRTELLAQHPRLAIHLFALDVNQHDEVFSVFEHARGAMGGLDRVVVNAGVGKGGRIGKGHFADNLHTVQTNFVAALAQCEAALSIFRVQNNGHLVTISSMSALRGLPKHLTAYAASKRAVLHLSEGIRADLLDSPIKVSCMLPGYIRTEINEGAKKLPFEVDAATGTRALGRAIDREKAISYVPAWPWAVVAWFMRLAPISWVRKMS